VGLVEVYPKQDGRNMVMVLGPDKKAQAAQQKRLAAEKAEDGSEAPATAEVEGEVEAPAAAEAPTPVESHAD
jgi:translation initiation factor IF-3